MTELVQRMGQGDVIANIDTLEANTDTLEAGIGVTNETSASSDSATSGLNGLIKRLLARVTTLFSPVASVTRLVSATGTSGDATNVKASAGVLYGVKGYNSASALRYLKLYNSASAPTAGAGTPFVTLALPPSAGFAFDWVQGLTFSSGIGFTLVTGSADNNASSVTAADIVGLNIEYT